MSTLVAVRLPDELQHRLDNLAHETGRSRSFYIKMSLERLLEDREDYLLSLARLEENNPRISYNKIRAELGLED